MKTCIDLELPIKNQIQVYKKVLEPVSILGLELLSVLKIELHQEFPVRSVKEDIKKVARSYRKYFINIRMLKRFNF